VSKPHGRGQGPVFIEGGAFHFLYRATLGAFLLLAFSGLTSTITAQGRTWNDPRVLGLIQEAREVRQAVVQDSTLRTYSSEARGYVYFYLDRRDTGERILVKTDQIALDVFWKSPNRFKQRIVGMRDEKSLPTNIHYHLDHLVVVQDEFGDRIRIGDGDEVEAVIHPVAPGSESTYDFLLADSVTLHLPASGDTVRVYEVQVRPKDFEAQGFIGSVFIDRDTRSIARMNFTFTPSSYVDDYLAHISISLENGLWEGRYWLPYRQQLEIRREVPYLDFPAGSVIRGSFEVRNYQINDPIPDSFFMGPTITAAPVAARLAFPFEEGLHAQLGEEGLQGFKPPPTMDEIRSLAISIARDQYLDGLGRTRFFLPSPAVSSGLRFNRAEGLFLGAGISHSLSASVGLVGYGGFSIGRERPTLEGTLRFGRQSPYTSVDLFLNRPRDLTPTPAISGVLNTFSAATLQNDYSDLLFASGVRVGHTRSPGPERELSLEARLERHRSAWDVVSSDIEDTDFRPVIPVEEGTWTSLAATGSFPGPWAGVRIEAGALAGRHEERDFGALDGSVSYEGRWLDRGTNLRASIRGGSLVGEAPIQAHYFLGGRGTVPGFPFRSRVGDAFWLLRTEGSTDVLPPFLRVRAFGSAGAVRSFSTPDPLVPGLGTDSTPLVSVGVGLGLGWDVLRLDLARGLSDGGDWELMLSVNRSFWPWL